MTTKFFVVSDIHGFYSLLQETLKNKGFEIDNPTHHLIVCGDAFDRGKEAKQLQDFLISLLRQNRLIYICGNHEDLLIDMVYELPKIADYIEWTNHASNGTLDTLKRLTGMTVSQIKRDPYRAQEYFFHTPFWKELVPEIIEYAEIGDYIFVHGWIPVIALDNMPVHYAGNRNFAANDDWRNASPQDWKSARWLNGMNMWRKGIIEPNKTIVCGHWHCSWGHAYKKYNTTFLSDDMCFGPEADFSPFDEEGILAIDGCVAYSGIMNCVVLEV